MDEKAREVKIEEASSEKGERKYLRWTIPERIEHWIFMASFTILAITGLVQKYPENGISDFIVNGLGGIDSTRQIHHISATIMLLVVVYHIGALSFRLFVLRKRTSMLPNFGDIRAAIDSATYYLGIRKNPPQQGRFTFEEKMEYWAVVWGTVVMAITGFMMWNPIATTQFLPGEFVPAAKAAHGGEALLAVLAIILWHLYHVLVKTFNRSMFTGYVTEEEMLDEHPIELADLKAGIGVQKISQEEYRRRLRIFTPVYGITAVALLIGVYWFVSFEKTAIDTLPPAERVQVFVPLTPTPLPTPIPTRTPLPGGLTSWEGGVAELFYQRCGICHNASAKLGGLDLTSYETAIGGGTTGQAIVPGDPSSSTVILIQTAGGHSEQLSPDLIQQLSSWIEAGAP